jgi:hypothetical protein
MSERAKEITSFVTPNGQVWRWNCMPFGIQSAPALFQELMERVIAEMKENPEVARLLEPKDGQRRCFIGAFFDDVGVGSSSVAEHLFLLEELFKVVQKHKLRIKLSKCEFVKESLEYLGFSVQWGSWRPSEKKIKALVDFKVRNLKDLRAFLGACNFFRRHVKSFTFSSAGLTDLLKKNARFVWTEKEESLIEEIKSKLLSSTPLGVPRSTGEMVVVTAASDRGGGAAPFFSGKPSTHPKCQRVFPQKGCPRMVRFCTTTQASFVLSPSAIGIGSGVRQGHVTQHLSKNFWPESSFSQHKVVFSKIFRWCGFVIMKL